MARVPLRDINPLLASFRRFLLGRDHLNQLRSEEEMAFTHTQPLPNLPDGPHTKLSANYYYTHDARREMKPPTVVCINAPNKPLQLGAALAESKDKAVAVKKPVAPGKVFHWD